MLIIGSTAIKNFFPDFPRNPKDLDYVVDTEDNKNSDNTEYLYNPIILKYQKVKYDSSLGIWVINGHSLQRTDVDGKTFYDKKSADDFKKTIDNQDFYFYHDNK